MHQKQVWHHDADVCTYHRISVLRGAPDNVAGVSVSHIHMAAGDNYNIAAAPSNVELLPAQLTRGWLPR